MLSDSTSSLLTAPPKTHSCSDFNQKMSASSCYVPRVDRCGKYSRRFILLTFKPEFPVTVNISKKAKLSFFCLDLPHLLQLRRSSSAADCAHYTIIHLFYLPDTYYFTDNL